MSEQPQPRICRLCDFPLIELDAYGERLCGCVACNNWQSLEPGEWHHLSDDDIIALTYPAGGVGVGQRLLSALPTDAPDGRD